MDAYRHITPIERGRIMTLFEQGHSPAAIAAELNRHKSTILRELKRNRDGESYDASKAQEKYDSRRKRCRRKRKLDDPELFALVKERFLKLHWSPEQIQYRLRHTKAVRTPSATPLSTAVSTPSVSMTSTG